MVMPEEGTKIHTWQSFQLRNCHARLNAKIKKELAENEGSTMWSDRVLQKKCDEFGNKWESKYAEFGRCAKMPAKGTTPYLAMESVKQWL